MAEGTDRDYAEAEKWTQGCPVCEGMEGALAKQIAAYRESCVAEERAAREKAEQEVEESYSREEWNSLLRRAEAAEARLRAVIEALKEIAALRVPPSDNLSASIAVLGTAILTAKNALRDAASPEPEASKRAGHAFHSGLDDTSMTCIHCGLPWSQHGGRDAR